MTDLKQCPCGEVPPSLAITEYATKWSYVCGTCCGEWKVEFQLDYYCFPEEFEEAMELATKAWNGATRKGYPEGDPVDVD